MRVSSNQLLCPKFIKASSMRGLENKMRDMILKKGKKYDFYNFLFDGKDYYAIYREELNFDFSDELEKRNKE
jgi:hypothetical protein